MSSATLAARASPHSSAMRCSATSIPAVMPALDASGPSTTNTRLSMTCACGARARSMGSSSWCVVQRRVPSTPARAASRVPEQIVTRRCGVSGVEERVAQPIVQPSGGDRDLRRDLGHVGRRLTDHHDPGRRAELAPAMERGRPASVRPTSAGSPPAPRSRDESAVAVRDASRCRLARRKASAGPAMSSSSECGTMTKSTSMSWARVIMCERPASHSIHPRQGPPSPGHDAGRPRARMTAYVRN